MPVRKDSLHNAKKGQKLEEMLALETGGYSAARIIFLEMRLLETWIDLLPKT